VLKTVSLVAALAVIPVLVTAQQSGAPASAAQASSPASSGSLDPASLLKPLGETWPTYSGDYTGRRYSALTQVNQ
jgi:alcohol dehydrogenase (cytochrome c)